jgi:hypothetical protein
MKVYSGKAALSPIKVLGKGRIFLKNPAASLLPPAFLTGPG